MTYNYQIQNMHKAKCMYIHVCVYLLHAYMHGSRNFRQVVGVRAQLVEKSPENVFSPQLILQCLFQRNYIFSRFQAGGSKMSGGPTIAKVMGPNCFFYRTCCFPWSSGLLVPPLDSRILPMCTCPCLWPFNVTKKKHAVNSSKA